MTQIEKEYFATFTLERLKAFYKAVSKETNFGHLYDFDDDCSNDPQYDGKSYVTRAWMRPGGKVIYMKINKRKIRNAIKDREAELNKNK